MTKKILSILLPGGFFGSKTNFFYHFFAENQEIVHSLNTPEYLLYAW